MLIKAKELRQKSKQEFEIALKENREKLRGLKFDLASKKLKNARSIGWTKKQIARILTILKQI